MKKTICIVLILMMLSTLTVSASDGNIAKGLPYTIEFGENCDDSYRLFTEDGEKFDIDTQNLTDGKTSGLYKAYRCGSRLICFDFGAEKAFTGYGGIFSVQDGGVYAPHYMRLWLSDNGTDYVCVNEYENDDHKASKHVDKIEISLDKIYKARYAKVEYGVEVFVFASEIYVYGNDNAVGASELPNAAKTASDYYSQGSDGMNGAKSIIKIYDGYLPENQQKADNTKDELLPYIAYVKNGKVLDTMFDSVAFVPCHTDYPSGGRLVQTGGKDGGIMSDWQLYMDCTFGEGINLDALEASTGERNNELKIDTKTKVFLTIPYPKLQSKAFGDIDGDGKTNYTRTLDERCAAIEWYVKEVCRRFEEKQYKNLELCGFYWYREDVNSYDSDHEKELIRRAKEITSETLPSSKLLFDAYYLAAGYDKWQDMGFDGAVMQPNLAFHDDYMNVRMLESFASTIKNRNMGIEIETAEPGYFKDSSTAKQKGKIYESYLYYGWKTGYINALATYYQGAGPGSIYVMQTSSSAYLTYLYDLTYHYVKKDVDFAPRAVEQEYTLDVGCGKTKLAYDITGNYYLPDTKVTAACDNGKVSVLPSKKEVYFTPDDTFVGDAIITITVKTRFETTETALTVHVKDPNASEPEIPSASDFPIISIICVGATLLMAIAAVIIVKKSKKGK